MDARGNGAGKAGQARPRANLDRKKELQIEQSCQGEPGQNTSEATSELTLTTLALGIPLTHFVARVALADHIDPTSATYDLAIGMSVLQGTNG